MSVLKPVACHSDGADKPEEHVDQIHPHGVLHALDVLVALRVFFDEQLYIVLVQSRIFRKRSKGRVKALTLPKMPNKTVQNMNSITSQMNRIGTFLITAGIK
jgi:hypothetical protein